MSNYNDLMNIARIKVFLRNYVYEDTITILKDYVHSLMVGNDVSYFPEGNMLQFNIPNNQTVESVGIFHEKFKAVFMSYLSDGNVASMISANAFREEDKDIYQDILKLMHNNQVAALYMINMIPNADGDKLIVLITL